MNMSLVYIFRDGWMPELGGGGKRGGEAKAVLAMLRYIWGDSYKGAS